MENTENVENQSTTIEMISVIIVSGMVGGWLVTGGWKTILAFFN